LFLWKTSEVFKTSEVSLLSIKSHYTMKRHFFKIILGFILLIQGCSPLTTALKPVATQNQQNLSALNNNVQVLLALYEPLLQASSQSLIYQHIGKVEQEMIAVVGAAALPTPVEGQTWEKLFIKAAQMPIAKREKYLERYQLVQSALNRGMDAADLEALKQREGWIYQAAVDKDFTPQQAHQLLKKLTQLKQDHVGNNAHYFVKAEEELMRYDPTLQLHRALIDEAQRLFAALKQEITTQFDFANVHSQAITSLAEIEFDMDETLKAAVANPEQLETTLRRLSQGHLNNRSLQDAAIDFLTKKLSAFIGRL